MEDVYDEPDTKEEAHKYHFRGGWARAELFDFLERGVISTKEFILLLLVDALVEVGKKDCFASNGWMARRISVTPRYVAEMISHLKKLGLVVQTGVINGRKRFLCTAWSHIKQPRHEGRGRGDTPMNPSSSPHEPQFMAPMNPSSSIDTKRETKKKHCRACRATGWVGLAGKLAEMVRNEANQGVMPHQVKQWSQAIKKLHTRDGVDPEQVTKVLMWYVTKLRKDGEDLTKNGNPEMIPIAYSGKSFLQKWEGLLAAFNRFNGKTFKKSHKTTPRIKVSQVIIEREAKKFDDEF